MKSLRFLDRRSGYSLAAIGLLLGMVVPSIVPAFASAGQLNSRSMAMSTSEAGANGVSYQLNFTPDTNIASGGGLVVQFCDPGSGGGPLIGYTCSSITGFSVASATLGTVKYNTTTESGGAAGSIAVSGAYIKWTAGTSFTSSDTLHITFNAIHNPTNPQTFFARVTSYLSANMSGGTSYASATSPGTYEDSGAVALASTATIGVTAYVLESMTFCVSGSGTDGLTPAPGPSCGTTGQAVVTPSMTLGEVVGTLKALDATHVSTGVDYAQLSTNASGGVVVNLKSNRAGCGGLVRVGATNCDIKPQTVAATGITAGNALFGAEVGSSTAVSGASNPSGTLAAAGSYDATHYFLDYDTSNTDGTGITSSYGSPLFGASGPVNQQYLPVTFGASIATNTPAGVYSANLSMIATGTF